MNTNAPTSLRRARYLLGFLEEAEVIPTLRGRGLSDQVSDTDLLRMWKEAKDASSESPSFSLKPRIEEIPAAFVGITKNFAKGVQFEEAVGKRKHSFKLVEIDHVVAIQKYVDQDYSESLRVAKDLSNLGTLIPFCLSEESLPRSVIATMDAAQQAHTILARGVDLRIVGMNAGEDAFTGRRIFSFVVGWGVPFITVVHYQDRYFLRNGYHRAYAARAAGVKELPCLVIEGEEYADTGAGHAGFFPQALLMSARPPIFSDLRIDGNSRTFEVPPSNKMIRLKADEIVGAFGVDSPLMSSTGTEKARAIETADDIVPFEIIREGWNEYRVADETLLRVRIVLCKVKRVPTHHPGERSFNFEFSQPVLSPQAPRSLRGDPSKPLPSPNQMEEHIVAKGLSFRRLTETENRYRAADGQTIILRIIPTSINRTDLHDGNGDPIYLVNSQTNVSVEAKGRTAHG